MTAFGVAEETTTTKNHSLNRQFAKMQPEEVQKVRFQLRSNSQAKANKREGQAKERQEERASRARLVRRKEDRFSLATTSYYYYHGSHDRQQSSQQRQPAMLGEAR